jgi:hypothetical protein
MDFVITWIKLSKTFGVVFLRINFVIYLLNLGDLCLPKDQGGLGFWLMKDVNFSFISKLWMETSH